MQFLNQPASLVLSPIQLQNQNARQFLNPTSFVELNSRLSFCVLIVVNHLEMVFVPSSVNIWLTLDVQKDCEEAVRLHCIDQLATLQVTVGTVFHSLSEQKFRNLISLIDLALAWHARQLVILIQLSLHGVLHATD